jgi:hypothetical protein
MLRTWLGCGEGYLVPIIWYQSVPGTRCLAASICALGATTTTQVHADTGAYNCTGGWGMVDSGVGAQVWVWGPCSLELVCIGLKLLRVLHWPVLALVGPCWPHAGPCWPCCPVLDHVDTCISISMVISTTKVGGRLLRRLFDHCCH